MILLRALIDGLDKPVISGDLDKEVAGLAYDSRQVKSGFVFFALRGSKIDGHEFIPKAISLGAVAIVAETAPPEDAEVTWLHVKNARIALAEMAAAYHGYPARHMAIGGVTGTNGKTTTAFILHHLLNHAHRRCGLLGTVVYDIGGELKTATHTTPESLELQGLLSEMKERGCMAVAMEVSSHAIDQHRAHGVSFASAIFTNLSQDHLDYHGTMEDYFKAKAKLFAVTAASKSGKLVINIDDVWGRRLVDAHKEHPGLLTYGLGVLADYRAVNPRYDLTGTSFELEHKGRSLLVRIPQIGQFNVYNCLAAMAAAHSMGCNLRDTVRALQESPQIPGRMERITPDNHAFHVFVDYAHTPDGLVNALSTARALRPSRVITVFGCGGDRDRTKRPLMARAVEENSDISILTSDNPRMEDPQVIMEDARKGFTRPNHALIADRREAIHAAIKGAKEGEIVVIAGKGHEPYQDIQGVKHTFDDRKVVRQLIDQEILIRGEKRMEARQRRDDR
ncbi:MAG: UDP-N-acetylmuramoyl-L-alanyl-D-glutamate--2,6-diaminopimelate ligase [Verrucomicrobium sp.]